MGKRLIMFVDDMNMPRVDLYGTQQPIALLKLFLERKGLYDRGKDLSWKNMKDVQVMAGSITPCAVNEQLQACTLAICSRPL
jgi:dynein heavy chain, axonemal